MKKLLLLPVILAFIGCDDIKQPLKDSYAFCEGCETEYIDEFVTTQNVLMEEFTGITCNNCPEAAGEIKDLIAANPGRVFTIGIHASNFAVPDSAKGYSADFRTPEGTEIYNDATPYGVPSAIINRLDYGEPAKYAKTQMKTWEGFVNTIIASGTSDVGLMASAEYNDTTSEVCLTTRFRAEVDVANRSLWYVAVLTESDIVAQQKMPNLEANPDYIHNHVLRASFNGTYGEAIAADLESTGSVTCISRSITLEPNWVAENCHVVLYVYDDDTKEIVQVIETELE